MSMYCLKIVLPTTGSEEREVLGVGSIPVAILPSRQDMKNIALQLHKDEIRNTSQVVLMLQYSP